MNDQQLTRRRWLQSAGGFMAAATFPAAADPASNRGQAAAGALRRSTTGADVTGRLARYMVDARDRSLPPEVAA